MSRTGRPLTWHEIEACLRDLGDELEGCGLERRTVVIVGGAFVAHHAIRRATTDVDVITALDDDIRVAAAAVADRHGLEPVWLNDRARPWRPSTFDPGSCHTALVHGALEVLMPGVDDVILMNIAAGNRTPNDRQDLRALWRNSSFITPQAAVDAFHKAYPLEDPDPPPRRMDRNRRRWRSLTGVDLSVPSGAHALARALHDPIPRITGQ